MDCNDIATILAERTGLRLTAAERSAVDAHLIGCGDCTAAWYAEAQLVALSVPAVPSTLLARMTGLVGADPLLKRRQSRAPLLVVSALLAGAALAGVAIVAVTERGPKSNASPSSAAKGFELSNAPAGAAAATTVNPGVDLPVAPPLAQRPVAVELVETDPDMVPIVRYPPAYPPEALAQGLEGHVQLKFDVTALGVIENVSVVESSDARFESAAIESLKQWRYLPRIVAGKRVRAEGIHTVLRFALAREGAPPEPRPDRDVEAALREFAEYSTGLTVALDRLAADDLRGAELELDELQALYGVERLDLWNFYGYLYTVEGNYGRAIDAYETAVGIAARSPVPQSGPYVPLATLYFARHQYDMSLKTLLAPNLPGGNRLMTPAANALLQKLAALGVTPETLAPAR